MLIFIKIIPSNMEFGYLRIPCLISCIGNYPLPRHYSQLAVPISEILIAFIGHRRTFKVPLILNKNW